MEYSKCYISVIIPSFNGAETLKFTLDALNRQSNLDFEAILVLDGSIDESFELVKGFTPLFRHFFILEQPNGGRSNARNNGARKANGNILLFLDDDIEIECDVVNKHRLLHEGRNDAVIIGTVYPNRNRFKGPFAQYLYRAYHSFISSIADKRIDRSNFYFTSAHFSLSRTVFESVGGFDETLSDAEDLAFAISILDRDVSIELNIDLVAYHNDNETFRKYISRNREYQAACMKIQNLPNKPINKGRDGNSDGKLLGLISALADSTLFSIVPHRIRDKVYGSLIPWFLKK